MRRSITEYMDHTSTASRIHKSPRVSSRLASIGGVAANDDHRDPRERDGGSQDLAGGDRLAEQDERT